MELKLSRTSTFYLASLLAGVSTALACGGSEGDAADSDSGLTAATLSSSGNSTMTGVDETGSDTAVSDSSTADPTANPSTTDSTTDPSTTDTTGDTGGSPYTGGWDIGDCQDDVVAGAWDPYAMGPGVVLPDWYLTDRYGEMVRVRDFCHNAIYVDYSALW